jgi:hypothetical protein
MPANVEIKARVENIDVLRARARSLAGSGPEVPGSALVSGAYIDLLEDGG